MDRNENPITGVISQKISSYHIKEAWLQLQELKKEVADDQNDLSMMKYNYSMEFIEDMIQMLE